MDLWFLVCDYKSLSNYFHGHVIRGSINSLSWARAIHIWLTINYLLPPLRWELFFYIKTFGAQCGDPRRMYFFTGGNQITVLVFLTPRNSARLLQVKVLLQSKRYLIYKLPNHIDTSRCGRMQDRMGMKNTKKTTLRIAYLLPMKRDRTGQTCSFTIPSPPASSLLF